MTVLKHNYYSSWSYLIMYPTIPRICPSPHIEPNLKVYDYYEDNVSASYRILIASAFMVNKVCINKLHFLNHRYCKYQSTKNQENIWSAISKQTSSDYWTHSSKCFCLTNKSLYFLFPCSPEYTCQVFFFRYESHV